MSFHVNAQNTKFTRSFFHFLGKMTMNSAIYVSFSHSNFTYDGKKKGYKDGNKVCVYGHICTYILEILTKQ